MTSLEVLNENFENVRRALNETLRYDFVPERSRQYFSECKDRLALAEVAISGLAPDNAIGIFLLGYEIESIAQWISLIERSHLGEFSWPFAEELHRLSRHLLYETDIKGDKVEPIMHVIADGGGYQISYEQVPSASSSRRFVIVAFPRYLKHHVLQHAIFGHELCHTAIFTSATGALLQASVIPHLVSAGPLKDVASLNAWVFAANAPVEVRNEIATWKTRGVALQLTEASRESWWVELVCDLFGLVLFGPSFLAAHKAILEASSPNPYYLHWDSPSHPPYAIRHKMLVRSMRVLGWDIPLTSVTDGGTFMAEEAFLAGLVEDPYDSWADIFLDSQLSAAINGIQLTWAGAAEVGFVRPSPDRLEALIENLCGGLPPQAARVSPQGVPVLPQVSAADILYAGWVYWKGREKLRKTHELSFLQTNRLCDLALLQQRAINLTRQAGGP